MGSERSDTERRRRFPRFLAVPVTLGLFFWLLAWAIEYANEHGIVLPG